MKREIIGDAGKFGRIMTVLNGNIPPISPVSIYLHEKTSGDPQSKEFLEENLVRAGKDFVEKHDRDKRNRQLRKPPTAKSPVK